MDEWVVMSRWGAALGAVVVIGGALAVRRARRRGPGAGRGAEPVALAAPVGRLRVDRVAHDGERREGLVFGTVESGAVSAGHVALVPYRAYANVLTAKRIEGVEAVGGNARAGVWLRLGGVEVAEVDGWRTSLPSGSVVEVHEEEQPAARTAVAGAMLPGPRRPRHPPSRA